MKRSGFLFAVSMYVRLSLLVSGLIVNAVDLSESEIRTFTASETIENFYEENECRHENIQLGSTYSPSCLTAKCGRRIVDGIFPLEDITKLHEIVQKGMATKELLGGPTILDINTGYIRDSKGLDNLFAKKTAIYSDDDFAHYGRIISKLKDSVAETFGISDIYFTAPTFITRLDGTKDWGPQGIHDEYWHPHADMNNTPHYHYSGLLYMSTYGTDFDGGRFKFLANDSPLPDFDPNKPPSDNNDVSPYADNEIVELILEPKAGRVVIFTAGPENTHYVERVTAGLRFVLSFWFTCDKSREFEIFLDGKAHSTFSQKMKDNIEARNKQQAAKQKATKTKPPVKSTTKDSESKVLNKDSRTTEL